jgi:Flp pilus assembly secretin CpaC
VPVFGSLFGSKNYKDKKTQLLLVVRPRVVAPQ